MAVLQPARHDPQPDPNDLVVVGDAELITLFRQWSAAFVAAHDDSLGISGHYECDAADLVADAYKALTRVAFTRSTGFARVVHFADGPLLDLVVISRQGRILFDQRIPTPRP